MSFEFLFFVSILAGGIGALSGMGGGVALIPALTLFGIDIKQAIAIGNLSVIAVSIGAAPGYVRRHMPNLKVSTFLEMFSIMGAFAGALLTLLSEKRILFLLCGVVLFGCGVLLWRRRRVAWKPIGTQDPFSRRLGWEGSYYDDVEGRTIAYRGGHAALAGSLIFVAGVTSGLLGIGGSALTVLILDAVIGLPPKVSLTMSNLIIGVMALAGANVYLEAGLINPNLVAPVILGVPLGALLGSKMLVHFSNQVARLVFLVVLTVLGIEMILHGVR